MSRDLFSFFSHEHTQFSRVIESSFISHIVHEVMGKIPGSRDTIDWHYGLGWFGLFSIFLSSSTQELQANTNTEQKPAAKSLLGYLIPRRLSGHLENHSNGEKYHPVSLSFSFLFHSHAFVCTRQQVPKSVFYGH